MNPCNRNWSISIEDAPNLKAAERCEMCGSMKSESNHRYHELPTANAAEHLYRLGEWCLWDTISTKALGSMLRVLAAKMINPSASYAQLGAVCMLSKPGLQCVIARIKKKLPQIHAALWGGK